MNLCFDSTALMCLFDENVQQLSTPDGKIVERIQDRVKHLIATIDEDKGTIVIPTPALAEFLTGAGNQRAAILNDLQGRRGFRIASFDTMAAIQCAMLDTQAIADGDKKDGVRDSWQKVKIDRQIVAIASVTDCERIVTGDKDVKNIAGRAAIVTTFIWDLELAA